MRITVLRKTEYKGCKIYILQFGDAFQYLFILRNEIYQSHAFYPRSWWRLIGYWLGIFAHQYNKEQMESGEEIILSAAIKSIDKMTKPGAARVAKRARAEAGDCTWQIRDSGSGNVHYCLTHKEIAPISNEKPKHK